MDDATPSPGQQIPIATVPNLRDLGGWGTAHGRLRHGLVYRSAEFSDLAGADLARFDQLGIRTVFDLRTEDERTAQPNVVPPGVDYRVLDVLADADGAAPAQLLQLLSDPPAAEQALGGGKAQAMFEQGYRQIVSLPSALSSYRAFFTDLASAQHRPAVFHCTTGKDRTGWAAASLLLLLGVSEEDVRQEYLLTNEQLLPSLQPQIDAFAAAGGDPTLLTPVLGVDAAYLDAALDEVAQRWGSVQGWFLDGLHLHVATLDSLREALVEH